MLWFVDVIHSLVTLGSSQGGIERGVILRRAMLYLPVKLNKFQGHGFCNFVLWIVTWDTFFFSFFFFIIIIISSSSSSSSIGYNFCMVLANCKYFQCDFESSESCQKFETASQ